MGNTLMNKRLFSVAVVLLWMTTCTFASVADGVVEPISQAVRCSIYTFVAIPLSLFLAVFLLNIYHRKAINAPE